MPLTSSNNSIRQRCQMLQIDQTVIDTLHFISPFIAHRIDGIIDRFYAHLQTFPEYQRVFQPPEIINNLVQAQRTHWLILLSGTLDESYQKRAYRIGQVHFEKGISLYLYSAGYSFFQCALTEALLEKYEDNPRLGDILKAVTKVINLDMDLAISAYTRDLWTDAYNTVAI